MVFFGLPNLLLFSFFLFVFSFSWSWGVLSSTPVACVMWASLFFFLSLFSFAGCECTKDHNCSLDPVRSCTIPVHILFLWQLTVFSLTPLPYPPYTPNFPYTSGRFRLGTKDEWNWDVWSVKRNITSAACLNCLLLFFCQIFNNIFFLLLYII